MKCVAVGARQAELDNSLTRPHHEVEYRKAGVEEWNRPAIARHETPQSAGTLLAARIDDSKLFFSHEHKWDEQLNSLVSSCLLMGPGLRGL